MMKKLELWYFYGQNCSICQALWPKIKALQEEEFPKMRLRKLNAAEHRELAGQHRMLSVPGLLFFVEGKEHYRGNGLLSILSLHQEIQPAYTAYYAAEL